MRTRAAVFHGPGRPLEVCVLELEEPPDDEVVVRIGPVVNDAIEASLAGSAGRVVVQP
jgi:hypothetical protein